MRSVVTALILLVSCIFTCKGQNQCFIGTDFLSTLGHGHMKLSFGYSISDRWSAEADISLNIKEFIRNKDSTENAHWGELYGYDIFQSNKFRETKTETGISFCYWPDRAFKGSFVGFGASFRDRNGFDLTPRIGYCCKIYKKLNIRLLYNIRIIESIKKEQISAEGIGIEIDYVF